jgi:hypothetical protein
MKKYYYPKEEFVIDNFYHFELNYLVNIEFKRFLSDGIKFYDLNVCCSYGKAGGYISDDKLKLILPKLKELTDDELMIKDIIE